MVQIEGAENQKDTRTRLLEAAISVIEQDGTTAVRVRDISKAAGVTYASLYHFFGDRDGLIAAAQAERYSRSMLGMNQMIETEVSKCRSRREFRALCRRILEDVFRDENAVNRMTRINVLGTVHSRPALAAEVAKAERNAEDLAVRMFSGAQTKGWIRQDLDLRTYMAWYFGQVNGRVLIELDPEYTDGATWNKIAIEAALCVLFGEH